MKDFERSVNENENDSEGSLICSRLLSALVTTLDDNVTVSFIHALFSENIDDDFRTMVEGHSLIGHGV